MNWILHLFDASRFMPRLHCATVDGAWGNAWLFYVAASLVLCAAYWIISYGLFSFYRNHLREYSGAWVLLPTASFFFFCGLEHAMDAFAFWWPAYYLATLLLCVQALLSVFVAAVAPVLMAWIVSRKDVQGGR